MQLASDLRPWRLRDFHWGADGHGLILVLSQAGSDQRVLAWLDLRARSLAPLTPDLAADAHYVGQVGGAKPSVLIAVRQSPAGSSRLQAVTPAGAIIAEWQPPVGHATRWLATGTHAVAVCTGDSTCTWWHTRLDEPAWSRICEIPVADGRASRPLAVSTDGQSLFALSSAGRDTLALVRMSAPDWTPEVISARERFDITSVLMAPDGSGPDLVTTTDPAHPQSALTSEAATDLARLGQVAGETHATITGRNSSHCLAEISFAVGGPGIRHVQPGVRGCQQADGKVHRAFQDPDAAARPVQLPGQGRAGGHRLPDPAEQSAALARGPGSARRAVVTGSAAI